MPTYSTRHGDRARRYHRQTMTTHVPRLELNVTHRAPERDIRPGRAHWQRDRAPWPDRDFLKNPYLVSRADTYGYDNDFVREYAAAAGHGQDNTTRVSLYTHDSRDPFSCTCYPRASSRTIPSMMYDQVRCPHPDHCYQPGEQDYFAYPWTVQSYRPHFTLQHGYKQGQVKPPSAVTAPPFTLYNKREDNPSKGDKPPPHSAPVKPVLAPLLSAKPSDRRLRRAERRRHLAAIPEMNKAEEEELSPFDSISQVGQPRRFQVDSLRLRTVDTRVLGRVESEMRMYPQNRAMNTPQARPVLDSDGFPQTPTRIFKGEYVDPFDGKKYQYDIKYGKMILDGKRSVKTV